MELLEQDLLTKIMSVHKLKNLAFTSHLVPIPINTY